MTKTLCKVVLVAMVMGFVFASCKKDEDVRDKYIGDWKYECEIINKTNGQESGKSTEKGTVTITKCEENAVEFGNPINAILDLDNSIVNGFKDDVDNELVIEIGGENCIGTYKTGATYTADPLLFMVVKESKLTSQDSTKTVYETIETFSLTK